MNIAFEGEVLARRDANGLLQLHGQTRDPLDGTLCATDVMLRETGERVSIPARLPPQVRLTALDGAEAMPRRFELLSAGQSRRLQLLAVQCHRAAGAQMFAVVPATPVPWTLRAAWVLLLSVLRIPGIGRWLLRPRGAA
jgi:hypothetical protein